MTERIGAKRAGSTSPDVVTRAQEWLNRTAHTPVIANDEPSRSERRTLVGDLAAAVIALTEERDAAIAERDAAHALIGDAISAISAARERIGVLEAALRPFAHGMRCREDAEIAAKRLSQEVLFGVGT